MRLLLSVSFICSLPIIGLSQFAHHDSKWLYLNEGPVDDCEFILMEMKADTVFKFQLETIKMSIIESKFLDSSMNVVDSKRYFLWDDSLNSGTLLSFFEERNGVVEREYEVFTYAFGNNFNTQWQAPINGGFAVGRYQEFDILEEDTFWFNDSISSRLMRFESTPKNNYMCETVIERFGSMGFMMAINRDKNDYRAGRLLWYYDSAVDTFFVPDSFDCNYMFTSVDNATSKTLQPDFYINGNSLHYKNAGEGGELYLYDLKGQLLLVGETHGEEGFLQIPLNAEGLLLINYVNNDFFISKKIIR